jgi:hypothetical protein
MINMQPLDNFPIWAIYPLTVLFFMAALEGGYRFGKWLKGRFLVKSDAGVGAISAAALALIGFLIAFTLSFAVNIFTERRQTLVEEANAIGTTYLRAEYLEEPYRIESQDLLREYLALRLESLEIDQTEIETMIIQSEEIHKELWYIADEVATEDPSPTTALYLTTLNDMIDLHVDRLVVNLSVRVPPALIVGIFVVSFLTLLLLGLQGGYIKERNVLAQFILVLILSLVVYLIIDLDRSQEGSMQISKGAFIELYQSLNL